MSAFPDTPKTLLSRMAAQVTGESEASWVRFFDLYQPVIRKFAEYVGAKGEAEDVTQDVFVKLVEVFRKGAYKPDRGRFRAYLATLIRREVVNRWHKAQVRAVDLQVSLDNDDFPVEVAVPSETAAILDAKWRQARRSAAIEHVLTKTALSDRDRSVYRAYALEGRDIGDVAKEFGISRNYVSQIKVRIDRRIVAVGRDLVEKESF